MVWPTAKHIGAKPLIAPPPAPPPPSGGPPLTVSIVPPDGSHFTRPTPGDIEVVYQAFVSGGSGDYNIFFLSDNPIVMTVGPGSPSIATALVGASDNVTGQQGSGSANYSGSMG